MTRYEIQVRGQVQARWARALGAEACRHLPDGRSVLTVEAVDAPAVYGLIARLRDSGLELVSLVPAPQAPGEGRADPNTATAQRRGDRLEARHAPE
jgi:hypothetical protein